MMTETDATDKTGCPLTPEHRMLLRIRDTLYEGGWADFVRDLRARMDGEPRVYEIVPTSDTMRSTILGHLRLIETMDAWERTHRHALCPDAR